MIWCYPLTFGLSRSLSSGHMCSASHVLEKVGEERSLTLSQTGFYPLCLGHDYYLDYHLTITSKCLQVTNTCYLPCFCIHFEGQTRGWIVNVLTRAQLSLVTENANRCKYPARSPLFMPHEMYTRGQL